MRICLGGYTVVAFASGDTSNNAYLLSCEAEEIPINAILNQLGITLPEIAVSRGLDKLTLKSVGMSIGINQQLGGLYKFIFYVGALVTASGPAAAFDSASIDALLFSKDGSFGILFGLSLATKDLVSWCLLVLLSLSKPIS
jgi:hypothetical protein